MTETNEQDSAPIPEIPALVRAVLDASMDAVVLMDIDGQIVEWNKPAEDAFGWSRDDAVGRHLDELVMPAAFIPAFRRGMEHFRGSLSGPVLESRQELTALHSSGSEFPIELRASVVKHDGHVLVIGYVRDRTEEMATEQQLAQQSLESELLWQATALTAGNDSFDVALQSCLDNLCHVTHWPVGHVYLVDESGNCLESSGVWHLESAEYYDAFRRQTQSRRLRRGEGFAGRIWETGEAVWSANITADEHAEISSDLHVQGAFGFPVKIDDDIVAVMEFYTPDEIAPDPQFLRLVHSFGDQLGSLMERRRLQEERTRQAAIVDSSSDAIISRTLNGEIISWNPGAERVYGYTAAEAMAGGFRLILPEGVADEDPEIANAVQDGSALWDFRTTRRRKDGALIEMAITVSPIRDSTGALIGASTIERDVTQLAVTQRELRASEETARLLLQSTAEAIYGVDLEGNCTFCNPACVRLLGWDSPADLLGRNMHEVMHHSRADGTPCPKQECRIYAAFQKQEGTHADDDVLWRKDGSSFPAEYWSHPIIRGGTVVGAVVTFLDITERVIAEQEQARLASIVASSSDGIIATDVDGTIMNWNRGAELIYGYSEREALGRSLSFLLPPGLNPQDSVVLRAIRSGDELTQFETVRWRKDEKIIDVSITVTPIRTAQGRLVGASTFDRDITSRRQREKELEQARDAAEAANRAKSEFLANISHELRTPMNAIIGMTDLALREPLSADVRDCLQTARDSADALLFLLNDILDFSRMEAGRFELDPVDFHLRRLIHDTIKSLALRADEKGLELTCQIDRDVPAWLRGDGMRLRQILSNLVTNAIKFTEQGEVIVRLRRFNSDEQRPSTGDQFDLHVAVTDTGIGISERDQQRIFAPFTQADASSTRRFSGTGLGLSICHKLTSLMNGRLWVDSRLGEGSTFHVLVRLTVAESGGDETSERLRVDQLTGLPVLIVDDNHTNQRVLSAMLGNWSLTPTVCGDAESAFATLLRAAERDEPYSLIIVDALMPDVDGFMLIERISNDDRLRHATILMLSSADRQMFRERCTGLPVSAYLEKPVSQADLLDAIVTAIRGPQGVIPIGDFSRSASRPLKILVAEDTPANQKVISRILSKRGHFAAIANNGREAVERSLREEFDIVLMDVQMPTMDGLQATAAIRKREDQTDRRVPIVAMTAHAMRGDREKCLAAGMDAYVSKPVDAEQLLQLIESLCDDSAASSSDTPSHSTSPEQQTAGGLAPSARATPMSESTDAVWDESAALQRLGNDRQLLNDLIGFFFDDSPTLLATVEEELQRGDAAEAGRAAHSLKGLCANFEGRPAVTVAAQIQNLAEQNDLAAASELVPQLKHETQRLKEHLALWQTTRQSGENT